MYVVGLEAVFSLAPRSGSEGSEQKGAGVAFNLARGRRTLSRAGHSLAVLDSATDRRTNSGCVSYQGCFNVKGQRPWSANSPSLSDWRCRLFAWDASAIPTTICPDAARSSSVDPDSLVELLQDLWPDAVMASHGFVGKASASQADKRSRSTRFFNGDHGFSALWSPLWPTSVRQVDYVRASEIGHSAGSAAPQSRFSQKNTPLTAGVISTEWPALLS